MANIQHSAIPDAQLHEPKGVAGAVVDKVYVSDGASSGAWKYPCGMVYGEIFITSGATAFGIAAASAYTKFDPGTDWANGFSRNVTLDGAGAQITIGVTGIYKVDFVISFATAALAAGTQYFFKFALNGTPQTRKILVQKNTAGIDIVDCCFSNIMAITANDVLSVHVAGDATSSATNITANEAALSAVLLRAT